MIKASPSLIKPRVDYFSEDPVFEAMPDAPTADATDEERKLAEDARAAYVAKLTVAIDTGDWSALRVAGAGEPTAFTMRPLPAPVLSALIDMESAGTGRSTLHEFAFRAALQSVTNLGNVSVTFEEHEKLGRIASLDFLEKAGITGVLGVRICRELGGRALKRATDLSGK